MPHAVDLLRSCSPTMSVGILSADLMHLSSEIALLEQAGIPAVHFDVMDGSLVPMMTVGPPFIKGVKTGLLKDVHLMVSDPFSKAEEYVEAGADIVTVHIESCSDIHPVLRLLGTMSNRNDPGRGLVRGVACNPDTPCRSLEPLLNDIDLIVMLAVDIMVKGFPFVASIGRKMGEVKEMISAAGKNILLCIDGGVKRNNIAEIAAMGADIVVSGSAIFDGKAPAENLRYMLHALASRND